MHTLLIQTSGSYEARSMLALAYKRNHRILRSSTSRLTNHLEALEQGAVPIGSVEFVRQAIALLVLKTPPPLSYPAPLRSYLHRQLDCIALYDLGRQQTNMFIKPAQSTKLFDGFIYSDTPAQDPSEERFRQEQRMVLTGLHPSTPLYTSTLVNFVSEWRIYVHKHKVIEQARYDDGPDNAPAPSDKVISEMIRAYKKGGNTPVAYSLDVGVLDSGETALVEVNDAWGLGLYRDLQDHDAYLAMLTDRWSEISTGKHIR